MNSVYNIALGEGMLSREASNVSLVQRDYVNPSCVVLPAYLAVSCHVAWLCRAVTAVCTALESHVTF